MNVNDKNLFFLQLPPPGSEGDKFDKLATNSKGIPIGETDTKSVLAVQLGYSDKDSIGSSLDELNDLAGQLNITLANPKYASVDYVVVFFNQIDPKNPILPPINNLLVLSREMLKEGNIGGTLVTRNQPKPDVPDTEDGLGKTATKGTVQEREENLANIGEEGIKTSRRMNEEFAKVEVQVVRPTGGNAWLTGNSYVAFLIAFAEMQNVLMRNKVVQGKVEIASMELIYTMAEHTAAEIMKIAKLNKEIHMAQAIMAGISIGMTVAGGLKFGAEHLTTVSTITSQIEKMVSSAVQADRDIPIAEAEALKELIQANRTITQRLMEKLGEGFRSDTDKIAQLLQLLDKIRESLHQSIAASLRK